MAVQAQQLQYREEQPRRRYVMRPPRKSVDKRGRSSAQFVAGTPNTYLKHRICKVIAQHCGGW